MLKYLRQSMLSVYEYCPALFYQEYILELKPYQPHFDFGTQLHSAIENYHRGKSYNPLLVQDYSVRFPVDFFDELEVPFETQFKHPFTGETLIMPVRGRMDAIRRSDGLYDFKSSKSSWSQAKADNSVQATTYLYHHWQETGELVPFYFVVIRKDRERARKPIDVLTTHRTVDDFAALWLRYFKLATDIEQRLEWRCRCRYAQHELIYT